MTRHLLDADVVGDVVEPKPSASLLSWMTDQLDEDLHIWTWTLAEIDEDCSKCRKDADARLSRRGSRGRKVRRPCLQVGC